MSALQTALSSSEDSLPGAAAASREKEMKNNAIWRLKCMAAVFLKEITAGETTSIELFIQVPIHACVPNFLAVSRVYFLISC